ncbi:MAG: hypothetical protein KQI62_10440 [Deltaproteobacteria bacterium]|nr:hypothetical protein [Deltaproteobacteria bacterium]
MKIGGKTGSSGEKAMEKIKAMVEKAWATPGQWLKDRGQVAQKYIRGGGKRSKYFVAASL